MKNEERISKLEETIKEQQTCLKDKDRRITKLEKKIRNIKKIGGSFLLFIPFLILIVVTVYGYSSTTWAFDNIPYDTEFWSKNPMSVPFMIYTFVTIAGEILLYLYLGCRYLWDDKKEE